MLSMLAVKSSHKRKSDRLCFMAVGHTKFLPDSRFGLLNPLSRHQNIGTVLDVEETILSTGIRENAGALDTVNNPYVPVRTQCPFTYESIVSLFAYKNFWRDSVKNLVGNHCGMTSGFTVMMTSKVDRLHVVIIFI